MTIVRVFLVTDWETPYHGMKRSLTRNDSGGSSWCSFEQGEQAGVKGIHVAMQAGSKPYKFFVPWTSILAVETAADEPKKLAKAPAEKAPS